MTNGQDDGRTEAQPADGRRRMVVGLLADPDLPASVARQLARELPGILTEQVNAEVCWQIDAVSDPFEAMAPGTGRLIDKAKARVRHTRWDIAICITDVPMRDKERVVVAEVDGNHRVALLSLPALGGLRLRRRTRDVVVLIVRHLTADAARRSGNGTVPPTCLPGLASSPDVVVVTSDDDVEVEVLSRRAGSLRLLAGMVRANRPWKLALGLSTVLAGALTGVAFGVLYSAIWQLAAALSPLRLPGMTFGAVATLTSWLILGHDLWERRTGARWRVGLPSLRNAAMVLTIGFGALVFFLLLFVLAVVAAVVVIPPEYLARHVGGPVGWSSYVRVALMASVLGTVAGAVGSGLENDRAVRRATYGYREQERWRELRRQEEREADPAEAS